MNLNPVVVIPTYWCGRRTAHSVDRGPLYDHMTPIDKQGELPRCLDSLRQVVGLGRIILLVVAEPGVETQAEDRVRAMADHFRDLNITIVGETGQRYIHRRFEQLGIGALKDMACLSGYGAVRNMGLLVASIFGHDTVIFLDDDEVVTSPDFLERAVYGIAYQTPGGSIITVEGKRVLHGGTYRIIADRIVGATYLCAAACCGGEVRLCGVETRPLSTVSGALSEAGCLVRSEENEVFLRSSGILKSIRPVRTAPYPGFPTDAQPVLMAALLKSEGSTVFVENIFENRYRHVDELARMGAEVRVAGRVAVVTGREHLHGARVKCTDLRAGAALVIAGLQAGGLTRISRIEHIDRGYERIEESLGALGAHVRRETDP